MRPRASRADATRTRASSGFTLIELLVVMFMLAGFMMFLTQMLHDSLRIWQRGEERASLEERAATALRLASADFSRLQAVENKQFRPGMRARLQRAAGGQGAQSNGRFVATFKPYQNGKPVAPDVGDATPTACDWFPEWRMVASVTTEEGRRLLEERERELVIEQEGQLDPERLEQRVQERLAEGQPAPPVDCLLRVAPTGEEDGCYLGLWRDVRLLDGSVEKRWVDGAEAPPLGEPLLTNLLHVETLFRSQWTESWLQEPGQRGGPEQCWDSARAQIFPTEHPVLLFGLDLGEDSATDPLDDVMPSWVQLRIVVDEGPDQAYVSLLAAAIDETTVQIRVEYPERMPAIDGAGYLKIGGEWILYRGHSNGSLQGVRRGARFTRPRAHRAGARVHVGREAVVRVPVAVAREYWFHVR